VREKEKRDFTSFSLFTSASAVVDRPISLLRGVSSKQVALVPESEIEKLLALLKRKEGNIADNIGRLEEMSGRTENIERMNRHKAVEIVMLQLNERSDLTNEMKLLQSLQRLIVNGKRDEKVRDAFPQIFTRGGVFFFCADFIQNHCKELGLEKQLLTLLQSKMERNESTLAVLECLVQFVYKNGESAVFFFLNGHRQI
jgi:hypothetical protein